VDAVRDRNRAQSLEVRSVPTFIFFSAGEEIRRGSGNLSRDEIRALFRSPDAWF
jgi:predicted DsbA family dithiol-disulfide isomerase